MNQNVLPAVIFGVIPGYGLAFVCLKLNLGAVIFPTNELVGSGRPVPMGRAKTPVFHESHHFVFLGVFLVPLCVKDKNAKGAKETQRIPKAVIWLKWLPIMV